MCPFIIKSGKRKLGETAARATVRRQATKLRQSAEWGMRALQGSFPCAKNRFMFNQDFSFHSSSIFGLYYRCLLFLFAAIDHPRTLFYTLQSTLNR
jgi:hypothetical protein